MFSRLLVLVCRCKKHKFQVLQMAHVLVISLRQLENEASTRTERTRSLTQGNSALSLISSGGGDGAFSSGTGSSASAGADVAIHHGRITGGTSMEKLRAAARRSASTVPARRRFDTPE